MNPDREAGFVPTFQDNSQAPLSEQACGIPSGF